MADEREKTCRTGPCGVMNDVKSNDLVYPHFTRKAHHETLSDINGESKNYALKSSDG